jgi:hypothetical protein
MHPSEIHYATSTIIAVAIAFFGAHEILCACFIIGLIAAGVALGLNKRSLAVALGAGLALALLAHIPSALAGAAGPNRSVTRSANRAGPPGQGLTSAGSWTRASL